MTRHSFLLKACDSLYAAPEQMHNAGILPEHLLQNWQLMTHQVETFQTLREGKADVVVNTAMTGDGKTLAAWLLPFIEPDRYALFMYPTNELLRDQSRSLEKALARWPEQSHWPRGRLVLHELNAAELDEVEDSLSLTKGERSIAVERLLDSELVLTNPDVFHLLTQMTYQQRGAAPDHLPGQVANRFRLFVYDEFHLFGAPQVAAALTSLLLLREMSGGRARFLFLSATPQETLVEWARQAGLMVHEIEGQYRDDSPQVEEGWRRILQPVDLHLWSGQLEMWIKEHTEDVLLPFFKTHRPGAKGVIIANSVATAHRLYAFLEQPAQQAGLVLGLNTGLTGQEERRASHQANLIIGTSTIDVGVDFRINLLIFESMDAASHLQRLGRLGRHVDDGAGHPFDHFEAHALLPEWVVEAAVAQIPAHSAQTRRDYFRVIEKAFPALNEFKEYGKRWAGLQAAQVLSQLSSPPIRAQYAQTYQQLASHFAAVFGRDIVRKYKALRSENRALLDEAASFRGSSPFMAVIVDGTRGEPVPLAYNLITLLRNAELELLDLDQVIKQSPYPAALYRHHPLAAYRLWGWLPEPRAVRFTLDADLDRLAEKSRLGVAITLRGFRVESPSAPGLSELNKELEDRELVVTLAVGLRPHELRRRLRLGFQVEIHELSSRDNQTGSVAFGRDALLLDTALSHSSIDPSGGSALIF